MTIARVAAFGLMLGLYALLACMPKATAPVMTTPDHLAIYVFDERGWPIYGALVTVGGVNQYTNVRGYAGYRVPPALALPVVVRAEGYLVAVRYVVPGEHRVMLRAVYAVEGA